MITRILVLPGVADVGMVTVVVTELVVAGEVYINSPGPSKSPLWSRSIHTVKISSHWNPG